MVTLGLIAVIVGHQPLTTGPSPTMIAPAPQAPAAQLASPAASFDKSQFSLEAAASPWVIVNKQRPLAPLDYQPAQLVAVHGIQLSRSVQADLEALLIAASQAGVQLRLISGYRSFTQQSVVYGGYVQRDGQATADTFSARPGHSEHQTGLAVDFGAASGRCDLQACFASTAEGQWLRERAYQFGFIERYGDGQQSTTGYMAESWHYRYVGRPLAAELRQQGNPSLEVFFGLPPAPTY